MKGLITWIKVKFTRNLLYSPCSLRNPTKISLNNNRESEITWGHVKQYLVAAGWQGRGHGHLLAVTELPPWGQAEAGVTTEADVGAHTCHCHVSPHTPGVTCVLVTCHVLHWDRVYGIRGQVRVKWSRHFCIKITTKALCCLKSNFLALCVHLTEKLCTRGWSFPQSSLELYTKYEHVTLIEHTCHPESNFCFWVNLMNEEI